MKLQQLLSEKVLFSEFKFGFELEAISVSQELEDLYKKFPPENYKDTDFDADAEASGEAEVFLNSYEQIIKNKRAELAGVFNGFFGFSDKEFKNAIDDSSVQSKPYSIFGWEINHDVTFEWATPVMNFSPERIQQSISFLNKLPEWGISTNNSCGFHIHLSCPSLSIQDAAWIVVATAFDTNTRQLLSRFGEFNFVNEYSNDKYLDLIKNYVETKQYGRLRALLSNEKYRLLRIHPQGTLEWRGPRNFLEKPETIKQFFLTLVDFVKWISTTLSSQSIGVISRDQFNNIFKFTQTEFGKEKKKSDMWADWMTSQDIQRVIQIAPWLLKAKIKNADILIKNGVIFWRSGTWLSGEWKNGVWWSGTWAGGTWLSGTWKNGLWKGGTWKNGTWENGNWENGTWEKGVWKDGKWMDGNWYNGTWENGTWHKGTWHNGLWRSGAWSGGSWKKGQRLKYTSY